MFSITQHFGKKTCLIFLASLFSKMPDPFSTWKVKSTPRQKKAARRLNRAAGKEVFNLPG